MSSTKGEVRESRGIYHGLPISEWWVDILHGNGREEKAGPFEQPEDAWEALRRIEMQGTIGARRGGKRAAQPTP